MFWIVPAFTQGLEIALDIFSFFSFIFLFFFFLFCPSFLRNPSPLPFFYSIRLFLVARFGQLVSHGLACCRYCAGLPVCFHHAHLYLHVLSIFFPFFLHYEKQISSGLFSFLSFHHISFLPFR